MFRDITSNLGLKITALLIAVAIWLYVSQSQGPEVTKSFIVPVQTRNLPENIANTTTLPNVTVTLRGSKILLEKIREENINAYVDFLDKKQGKDQVFVKVDFPQTVRLVDMDPNVVSVDLQKLQEKELPIVVTYYGQAPAGITLGEAQTDPKRLIIYGPSQGLSNIKEVHVKVNRALVKEGSNRFSMSYDLVDNNGKPVKKSTLEEMKIRPKFDTISVEIKSSSKQDIKTVGVIANTTGTLPTDRVITEIDWAPKSITISGPYATISKIESIYTEPYNLNGILSTTSVMVPLSIPLDVSADASEVRVTIKIEPLSRKKLNLYVDVKPTDKQYEVIDRIIEVTFQGPSSIIATLTTASATIDVSGLPQGEQNVKVQISGLPDGITVLQTPTVKVKII